MKRKLYINCTILACMLLVSCYDDKGSYDYTEMTKVEVKGLEKTYTKMAFQDVLTIDPEITVSNSSDKLAYLWTINREYDENDRKDKIPTDTIGREKILNFPVNLKKGNYDLILRVTNLDNEHETYHTMKLEVVTKFSTGYYFLKDMGGYTELDAHLPDGSVASDLLEKSLGRKLAATPTSMEVCFGYSYINPAESKYEVTTALGICAGKEVEIMNIQDMTELYSHSTMFLGEIPDDRPYYFCQRGFGLSYISDKGWYFSYQAPAYELMGVGKFGYPIDVEGECAPNKNVVFANNQFYLFDELNHRFLAVDYNGSFHKFSTKPTDRFLPTNIEDHLVFFGCNAIPGAEAYGYALFEDKNTPDKHSLYVLRLVANDYKNPVDTVISIPSSSKLNKATLYASNERDSRVIYFVNNNQLYMYNVAQGTEETVIPKGIGAGEEITYVKNKYYMDKDHDPDNKFNYLVIGTHKDGKYKVYMYEILGGKPYGDPQKVFEGEGKVVSVQYTSSKMNSMSFSFYSGSM